MTSQATPLQIMAKYGILICAMVSPSLIESNERGRLLKHPVTPDLQLLVWLFAVALLSVAGAGCGSAKTSNSSTQTHSATFRPVVVGGPQEAPFFRNGDGTPPDQDGDGDAHGSRAFFDSDDSERNFGHPANKVTKRAVALLIKSYYTSAATHDWATVCKLVDPTLVRGLVEENQQSSQATRSGQDTCVEAVSKLLLEGPFKWSPTQAAAVDVADLRIEGNRGLVLERLGSEDYEIDVQRVGRAWNMESLFESLVR